MGKADNTKNASSYGESTGGKRFTVAELGK